MPLLTRKTPGSYTNPLDHFQNTFPKFDITTSQSAKPSFTNGTQTEDSDGPTQSKDPQNDFIPVCHVERIEAPSDSSSSKAAAQAAQNTVMDDVPPNSLSSRQDHVKQKHPSLSASGKQVIEGTLPPTIEPKALKSSSVSDGQSSSKPVAEVGNGFETQDMVEVAALIQKQAANPDVEDAMLQTVLGISKIQSMINDMDKKQGAGSSSRPC